MKQIQLGSHIKHDKVGLIKVKHDIDYLGERSWNCWIEGGMCIYHSSGGYDYKNIDNEDKQAVLKCLIEELKNELIEDGYKKENIKVEVEYMNEQEFEEWIVRRKEENKRDLEYTEKEIKDYKDKLTEALKKKVELNKPKDYNIIWKKFVESVGNHEETKKDTLTEN